MTTISSNDTDKLKFKIIWKEGASAPVKLWPRTSVLLNGVIYVAGLGDQKTTSCQIYAFNPAENIWKPSIKTQFSLFSLAAIQDTLVFVGGICKVTWYSSNYKTTNKLHTLDKKSYQWYEFTQMSTPRALATVVGHDDMLIVTGGYNLYNQVCKILRSTEVLNTVTNQWFPCDDLPQPHYQLQSAVVKGQLYLLGGKEQDGNSAAVYTAFLSTLSQGKLNWKCIEDTSWCRSSVTSLFGTDLLVIGGRDQLNRTCNVYTFDDSTNTWKVISQIPEARSSPCVTTTTSNVIVVIGGGKSHKAREEGKATNTVWFGLLDS